ncbi:MAG: endonuclease/exonuclease/phosphatase family protein [Clostridia bacterium]|nr:endonuclease/exonuclease/phosphatase family protein [Clostridia bacterium]MBO7295930.1 endonuclease/exonuclease/phosphatase family protein [Clostridia bacterium]
MKSFKLASYNICSSHFLHGKYTKENLELLSQSIAAVSADAVCLQEVDKGASRSEGVDMTAKLAHLSGYAYYYFIKIRDFQGGEYGTAILSRYPIVKAQTLNFAVRIAKQGTSCGYVVLDVDGQRVTLFNTHLSIESEEANTDTMLCLGNILDDYAEKNGAKLLCCGDFNTNPPKLAEYLPRFSRANADLLTYADRSIDNVLYLGYQIENVHTVDTTTSRVTDHNMLVCDVLL